MYKQILPTSTIRNIWGTLRRTCMLILGLKELTEIEVKNRRVKFVMYT